MLSMLDDPLSTGESTLLGTGSAGGCSSESSTDGDSDEKKIDSVVIAVCVFTDLVVCFNEVCVDLVRHERIASVAA